ncbi:MAG: hypothetical protein F6K65_40670 [Moorea sp. SIO3C2]|nr:hypothetical protein [Moorena sp. SIO3C2]
MIVYLLPLASCLLPLASCLLPLASCLLPLASCLFQTVATRNRKTTLRILRPNNTAIRHQRLRIYQIVRQLIQTILNKTHIRQRNCSRCNSPRRININPIVVVQSKGIRSRRRKLKILSKKRRFTQIHIPATTIRRKRQNITIIQSH